MQNSKNLVYYNQDKDKKMKLFKKGVKTIENYLNNKLLGLLRLICIGFTLILNLIKE